VTEIIKVERGERPPRVTVEPLENARRLRERLTSGQ
jgi:hypothetical protein